MSLEPGEPAVGAAVVDASVVVAALIDDGPVGTWAERVMVDQRLWAPHHLPAEVMSVLRRMVVAERLEDGVASMARLDLHALPITFLPLAPFSERSWDLRRNISVHDAWYVAMAEEMDVPLATLDQRLVRVPGPRCLFLTPPLHS